MGVRYKRTKSVAPGVKVNLNKKSSSVRLGGKGAGVTFNTNGKVTHSAGIPGTGLYYTDSSGGGSTESDDSCCLGCLVPAIFLILILSVGIAFAFSECTKKPPEFSGIDVFTISDHPIFGDSFNEAKEFYKDYLDDNIVYFSGNYQQYEDNQTLITFDSIGLDEKKTISDIQLYFSNTEIGSVDLEKALKISKEYLPIEMLRQYYVFDCSYMLTDFDYDASNELSDRYIHIVHYKITESGSQLRDRQIKDDNYKMPYEFSILLYSKNNSNEIYMVRIVDSLNEHYRNPDFSKDHLLETKWDYDFLVRDSA